MGIGIAVTCWMTCLLIGLLSLWVSKWRKPVHFFTGTSVDPKEITDIRAYNRTNALMWAGYAACFILVGVVSIFSPVAGLVLMLALFSFFIPILYLVHKRIYAKYKTS